ncbi:hypothetical protein TFKS16_1680 [Tannerella forsythia KS16]|uniref:Uncharacterized protein n=1 Tax=Tannerella forsythia (strain ATCC 43037 / JCM 10827 / CCUG 21028 A / KCTC 5666 / FDC 338) TaxID=203275 RepID=G8UPK8_TANFA|nr:hypothetical protein BFO_1898 [Tannerella forsythia 92A2]BAR49241.1 hypothetical protein TF3313_1742 [Tannerella forsythia 3313]BAR51921.1 hypothetical protein TFKS16_1680 [Tannerella forsythia KS16]
MLLFSEAKVGVFEQDISLCLKKGDTHSKKKSTAPIYAFAFSYVISKYWV